MANLIALSSDRYLNVDNVVDIQIVSADEDRVVVRLCGGFELTLLGADAQLVLAHARQGQAADAEKTTAAKSSDSKLSTRATKRPKKR